MPKLTCTNFNEWNNALEEVEYYADWDADLIDIQQNKTEEKYNWDGARPTDKTEHQNRKLAYALVKMSLSKDLHYLLHSIRPGDVKEQYKRIFNRFCRLTPGALRELKADLESYTQASSATTIEVYASRLEAKHLHLLKVQKKKSTTESDQYLTQLLLCGVLQPEFTAMIVYLQLRPDELTFSKTLLTLMNFAHDHKLMNKSRGKPTLMLNTKTTSREKTQKNATTLVICRAFQKTGKCRWGDKCKFKHEKKVGGEKTPTLPKEYKANVNPNNYPKGSCYGCGSTEHYRNKCPTNKEHKEQTTTPAQENGSNFMIKVVQVSAETSRQICLLQRDPTKSADMVGKADMISDSASTLHICPFPDAFVEGTITECTIALQIGNGTKDLMANYQGTIRIQPTGYPAFNLVNALFVPECPFIIFSERLFDQKKCAIIKWQQAITFTQPPSSELIWRNPILHGTLEKYDNLYHLDGKIIMSSAGQSKCLKMLATRAEKSGNCVPIIANGACAIPKIANVACAENTRFFDSETEMNCCVQPTETIFNNVEPAAVNDSLFILSNAELHQEHLDSGHQSYSGIRAKYNMAAVLPKDELKCEPCARWKTKRAPTKRKHKKTKPPTAILEVIETDIATIPYMSYDNEWYFQIYVDVFSRKYWHSSLQLKSQHFQAWKWLYERLRVIKPNTKLKRIRGGGEYDTNEFKEHSLANGYLLDITSPHTEKAWFAERGIGIIRPMVMTMIDTANASFRDWCYAVSHSCYLLNEATTAALPKGVTRNQVWEAETYNVPPKIYKRGEHTVWGCFCQVKIFPNSKLMPQVKPAMFLGSDPSNSSRSVVRLLDTGRIFSTKNVKFDKTRFPCKENLQDIEPWRAEAVPGVPPDAPGGLSEATGAITAGAEWRAPTISNFDVLTNDEIRGVNDTLEIDSSHSNFEPNTEEKYNSSSTRIREPSTKALENICNSQKLFSIKDNVEVFPTKTPNTVAEAMNSPYSDEWKAAMDEEMQEIWRQNVYTLAKPPPGVKPIGSRWVFKIKWKHNPHATSKTKAYEIVRFKARWVATGYNQTKGIDFKESYAYVIQNDSIRILVCLRSALGLCQASIDFKNFYLQGVLAEAGEKPFYAKQPQGYVVAGKEDHACRVTKGLYGYPPSGRVAQVRLIKILTGKCKLSQNATDPMLFRNDTGSLHCGYHVDDGLFISTKESQVDELAKILSAEGMKGPVIKNPDQFLGTQFEYYPACKILCHQESHAIKLLSQTGYMNSNIVDTPMIENAKRPEDEDVFDAEGITEFQEVCGNIIWLLRTRYDLAFATQQICMKMSCPTSFDRQLARRMLRYIKGNPRRGLTYRQLPAKAEAETYTYCDAALSQSRPHIGVAVFIGVPDQEFHINKSAAVSVISKQMKVTCLDTMHAELIAIAEACKASQYVTDMRDEMGYTQTRPTTIFTDNKSAINFLKGDVSIPSKQSRHLRRRYDFIREAIKHRRIQLEWVPTDLNCADVLTKPLSRVKHERHSLNLMGHS